MTLIFVNYRTGDEEGTATLVERELSRRFGNDNVFRASKSIEPGRRFPQEIITAVRRSRVLIAVIGPHWIDASSSDGRPALANPDDWTRREIREAFESAAIVIPLLVDKTERLRHEDLPEDIGGLADCQYLRYNHRDADSGIDRLAGKLTALVPELAEAAERYGPGQPPARPGETRSAGNQVADQSPPGPVHHQQNGGIGNVHGGFSGTYVSDPQGPVHTGSGHLYQAHEQQFGPQFTGDGQGVNYIAGDNSGTVNHRIVHGRPPQNPQDSQDLQDEER
ncbi:toll/interleukin-1 receptor domain-containing protein [Streptomyces sp. NPDC058953]|uniref:toll/interleukin-1 receptor domain-containing protein n=1 Tax=unclassified Streptomyces TaxID=2593676 RepID=UPI0036D0FE50